MPLVIWLQLLNHSAMNLELHSDRLAMTPFTQDDLDLSLEMFTDPTVVKYAGGVMSKREIKKNVANWTMRGGNGCIGIWTVTDRSTGEKYGSAALLPMPIEDDDTDYSLVVPGKMPMGDKAGFTDCGTMRCYGDDGLNFRITRRE